MGNKKKVKKDIEAQAREVLYYEPDWSQFSVHEPEWKKYPQSLWGLAGVNLQQVTHCQFKPARRRRIGRGIEKAGFCRLENVDLLVSPFYVDGRRRTPDFACRIKIYRSCDDRENWIEVPTKGEALLGVEPSLQALRDGGVLLLTAHRGEFLIYRSDDGGVNWTMTAFGLVYDDEKVPFARGYHMVRNVLEQPDGGLIMFMSLDAPRTKPKWTRTWLYRSSDGGRTWKEYKEAKVWEHNMAMFVEASFLQHSDGRLLALSRSCRKPPIDGPMPAGLTSSYERGNEADGFMMLTESNDNGVTWTTPRAITNYGEVHGHLLELEDGRLLHTYASYHIPYGTLATLSEDGGMTWSLDSPIHLAPGLSCYTGWPTSVQLPNGDIITASYYTTAYQEGEGTCLDHPGKNDGVTEVVTWQLPPKSLSN